jgi:hypothetical protein
VQGVECSNHSVPTNKINDLAKAGANPAFLFLSCTPAVHPKRQLANLHPNAPQRAHLRLTSK